MTAMLMMLCRADRQHQLREALASSSAADEASVGLLDNEASPPVEPFVGQSWSHHHVRTTDFVVTATASMLNLRIFVVAFCVIMFWLDLSCVRFVWKTRFLLQSSGKSVCPATATALWVVMVQLFIKMADLCGAIVSTDVRQILKVLREL